MMYLAIGKLVAAFALASCTAAHGFIKTFTVDGVQYEGYDRGNLPPPPDAIGWSFTTPDEGAVLDMVSPDFICRHGAEPSVNSAPVPAGGNVTFYWTSNDHVRNPDGWAPGHKGPILTYLAPCNGDCVTVDKSSLRWTKIAEAGLISGPSNTEGIWATDEMRANGGINSATIPASIAPGNYVIRNEIIALHRAHLSEPEFYMQCGSISVTGSGNDKLADSGLPASELYSHEEKQIFGFSVHDSQEPTWTIPGPTLYQANSRDGKASAPDMDDSKTRKEDAASTVPTTFGTSTVSVTTVQATHVRSSRPDPIECGGRMSIFRA